MNLNENEKVIYKISKKTLIQDQHKYVHCNITITNERFLIERDGILNDFKLIELESFRYIKNIIFKSGLQLKLKNGFTYDLALTKPDSLLQKIEAVISKKTQESDKPISNKAANTMIMLGLIAISISILYFSYNAYDNFKFNSDPIQYIENSSELSNNVNYRSNDLVGYPYLHGTWEYYDRNTDYTTRLFVMMYDDGEYKKGRYIMKERDDQEKSEGKDFSIRLQGEFTLKKGKDEYGDEMLIAHDKKLLKELYWSHNYKYPFLINPAPRLSSPYLKIGPYAEKTNGLYGNMKKISNRSFSINKKNSSNVNVYMYEETDNTERIEKVKIKNLTQPSSEKIEIIEDEKEVEVETNYQTAIINVDNLNLRSAPEISDNIIGKLKINEKIIYLESISINKTEVTKGTLNKIINIEQDGKKYTFNKHKAINILGPNGDYELAVSIPLGNGKDLNTSILLDDIDLIKKEVWAKIEQGSKTGYVYYKFLNLSSRFIKQT